MSKPRVAIFDFACCEGCQLQIVNLEEEILNLIDLVDVVEWREAMSEQSHEYDIAIIEGSITRPEDAQKAGSHPQSGQDSHRIGCLCYHGRRQQDEEQLRPERGSRMCLWQRRPDAAPEHRDDQRLLMKSSKSILRSTAVPSKGPSSHRSFGPCWWVKHPSCRTIRFVSSVKPRETICRYEYNEICLGPISRAGCGAPCPTAGWRCFGCRGTVDDPNVEAAQEVMDKYNLTVDDLKQKMVLFNTK